MLTHVALHAQHGHLNTGAVGVNPGDKLNFANGAAFAASSGYIKQLNYTNSGNYAGYFEGSISFTALPTTVANGGPVPGAAAPGSFIRARIDSVTGPSGASFAFWEDHASVPTISYRVGSSEPSATWALSDASSGAGTLGGDPFGHLHGRRFTTDSAGDYTVRFSLLDSSTLGPGGGPIHAPSDPLTIAFRAVPEPSTLALAAVCAGAWLVWRKRRNREV